MTQPATEEPLSRRRAKTRAALVGAARALFASRGVDAVTIDEIVVAADVAKGTFYNHFADKDALARAVARSVRADLEEMVAATNAEIADPAYRVVRGVCQVARFACEQPERARAMGRLFRGAADPDAPMNRGLRADVVAAIEAGRFAAWGESRTPGKGVAREAMVLFVIGTAQAILVRILEKPGEAIAIDTARSLGALLLRGLGLHETEASQLASEAAADVFGKKPRPREKHA